MSINGKNKKNPTERIRGEREEILEEKLTQLAIENMREEVMILLDDEERLQEKAKEAAKNFGSQIKTNELQRNELRRTITSGRRRITLVVEEYLTASNEVVRVRKDTGEQIGQRTATPRELQEELPLDSKAEEAAESEDDDPQQSDADLAEMEASGGSAFGAEPQ